MKQVKYCGESMRASAEARSKASNKKGWANGGRVKAYPAMDDGAASGPGRLEKIKAYGGNAKKK